MSGIKKTELAAAMNKVMENEELYNTQLTSKDILAFMEILGVEPFGGNAPSFLECLKNLATPTDEAKAALKEMGINV